MEIIRWARGNGVTIILSDDEAKSLSRQLEDPNIIKITLEDLEIEIEG